MRRLEGGDTGRPIVVAEPTTTAARELTKVAERVAAALMALPGR